MSEPFSKCAHCPALDRLGPCLAQTARHPRYCAFVDPASPDHRPAYIALLAGTVPEVTSAEDARLRRAAKPRVPLGTRYPPATGD